MTLVFALRGALSTGGGTAYIAAQIAGGVAGTFTAHLMFDLPLVDWSEHARTGPA